MRGSRGKGEGRTDLEENKRVAAYRKDEEEERYQSAEPDVRSPRPRGERSSWRRARAVDAARQGHSSERNGRRPAS